jgi:uncharacterized protein (DUF1684 family)
MNGRLLMMVVLIAGCAAPDPSMPPRPEQTDLAAALDTWQSSRRIWLMSPESPLSQVALCRVDENDLPAAIGPAHAPCPIPGWSGDQPLGSLIRRGDTLSIDSPTRLLWVGALPLRQGGVLTTRGGSTDGAVAWRRSHRIAGRWTDDGMITLLINDTLSSERSKLGPIERWPVDTSWWYPAKFNADEREVNAPTVAGFNLPRTIAGTVTFRYRGKEIPLTAYSTGRRGGGMLVVLRDITSGSGSYPAGRFLDVPPPDSLGWTVLDFNRARNPDCAFTPFSPCPAPPLENHLPFAVTAGERMH